MSSDTRTLTAEMVAPPEELGAKARLATIWGLAALAVVIVGSFINPDQFFRSYLLGYMMWLSITVGALAIGMLLHVTRGAWGVMSRRTFEAAQKTLPLMTLLFIPIIVGMPSLYTWANPEIVAGDELLQHKLPYLNRSAFIARAALYFAVWNGLVWLLGRWSAEQDRTGDRAIEKRLRLLSAPGIGLYCLTTTFAAFDWMMSLDPHWFSSMYGVYLMGCQGLAATAFLIVFHAWLIRRPPMNELVRPTHMSDFGNLMFAFVLLWTYFSLSQFLIIWSGNLPEETVWYLRRLNGGWNVVGVAIVFFHFAVPFLVLMSRFVKYSVNLLAAVAMLVLIMRVVDFHWQIAPTYSEQVTAHWLDLAVLVAIGGIWKGVFLTELRKRPLLPVGDPNLEKALDHVLH